MVPTLFGRIQTRLWLLAGVGGLITVLLTPVLPMRAALADKYQTTFVVLGSVAVIGVVWEFVYHLLMQWRWEKDWPTLFGLVTAIPEGLLVGYLATQGLLPFLPGTVAPAVFAVHFVVVWLAVWLIANGPMRVPFVRWRFRGGRLL
jgi:heme/copper-type cytochrome/quinol oxidase subunit 4